MSLMSNCAQSTLDVILKYNIRRSSMYKTPPEKGWRIHHAGGSSRRAESAGAVDRQRSGYDYR